MTRRAHRSAASARRAVSLARPQPWTDEDEAAARAEDELERSWRVVLSHLGLSSVCPRGACQRSQACLPGGRKRCLRLDEKARAYVAERLLRSLNYSYGRAPAKTRETDDGGR